jgi:hypothetical protein
MDEPDPLLRLEYGETTQLIRQLADIRFRLLATVPSVAGIAVALLSRSPAPLQLLAVGLIGFTATLGILLYELRNTELYDRAIVRAAELEGRLGMGEAGGAYAATPPRGRLFGVLRTGHERGLALVYAAALAAWAYLVVWGLLAHEGVAHAAAVGAVAGVLVGAAVDYEIVRAERR